ncbi:MAG: lysophospholipase [Desulfobacterota bacterium]|nr:lysophospholipase [Thermodesulfobacteriota bacterium]
MRINFSRFFTASLFSISILLILSLLFQFYIIGDTSIRCLFTEVLESRTAAQQWFYADKNQKPRGVSLVIHGLNTNPDKMHDIIDILNKQGIDVLNLSLRGHGNNYHRRADSTAVDDRLDSLKNVSFLLWLQEAHNAYLKVLLRARRFGVPVSFVGYSLGGLMGCTLMLSHPHVRFHRMILFAPALAVQQKRFLLKPLTPFTGFVIDSLSPIEYRSNSGTPVGAYNALFDALSYFEHHVDGRIDIPTLIFIDEQDEFIDYEALQALLHERHLEKWRLIPVNKDTGISDTMPHHIIIDRQSTGTNAWREIESFIVTHLR